MNTTLEDRLRRHYDDRTRDLAEHGPGLERSAALTLTPAAEHQRSNRTARIALVVGSVAAAAVIGVVLMNGPANNQTTTEPASTGVPADPTVAALAPVATLPQSVDLTATPVTVDASSPTAWYRLQPDLDISWYQDPTAQSAMLCWRTPVGSDCAPDDGSVSLLPLIVPTAGGQTLVVTSERPDLMSLDVQLSDGAVLSAPVSVDAAIDWGVARYVLPEGQTIAAVGRASTVPGDQTPIPGQTLPPTVDLIDVPLTVPAGSPLNYWRWLPDLDISERATAQGGTELCWRTPSGTGCIDDSFISPQVGIIPTDGGVILLAQPALIEITPPPTDPNASKFELGPDPTSVTATLSDGSTLTAEVMHDDQYGVGYARIQIPAGITLSSAVSQ
ncbi:MAG: hypothetical protein ABIR32_19235 [Ilumatobacteraceae bacterium]